MLAVVPLLTKSLEGRGTCFFLIQFIYSTYQSKTSHCEQESIWKRPLVIKDIIFAFVIQLVSRTCTNPN